MRLLDVSTLKLKNFVGGNAPRYAILSHTWGGPDDEVVFEDVQTRTVEEWTLKEGAGKVLKSAQKAAAQGLEYIWIDSCCIDKSSSAELSEAINSMFSWYRNSSVCYAYLSDILSPKANNSKEGFIPFRDSRWFTRGWTVCLFVVKGGNAGGTTLNDQQLQELIAPKVVIFYDAEWVCLGGRRELAPQIHERTGIMMGILTRTTKHASLEEVSVHTKMVWATQRKTTRVEDRAYSLLGLFGVNMPLLYGEGQAAFFRLQRKIFKQVDDQSILLHGIYHGNLLARSPDDFYSPVIQQVERSPVAKHLTIQKVQHGIDVSLLLYPPADGGDRLVNTLRNIWVESNQFPANAKLKSFWGVVDAAFADDLSKLDRPVFLLVAQSEQGSFRRDGPTIYRARHGKGGQIEIYQTNATVLVDIIKPNTIAKREIVRISNTLGIRTINVRFYLTPIIHNSGPVQYEYDVCSPEAQNSVIFHAHNNSEYSFHTRPEALASVVLLKSVGPRVCLPSVAVLIFVDDVRRRPPCLHLVDLCEWLGKDAANPDFHYLEFYISRVSSLPLVTAKYSNPDRRVVEDCLKDLWKRFDPEAGTSTVVGGGLWVRAFLRKETFLEDEVQHLHVQILA
ncbi:heterokaryon incompatibility protein-domain-containing protein [Xylariaceae sp. FL0255]|nr:heterokaryon incompatibility protein-domain-containing protein [Xylariaceae sp. FL0255]